ncbi:FtsK/SpoIIIE domain-containing protein [Nocardia sp. JCM 34519.1]|uniref:FtsK/SpoIIIE domain-containing protein n=2 Tax=unclassified Nocardia TaxID=2637762 RepID=UPI001CE45E41|nr:FtsK/SpoIIIE domain-containing protein [Nocardia sp. JCM 34519.1]
MSILPILLSAGAAAGLTGAFVCSCLVRRVSQEWTHEQIVADAPPQLRPAVFVLADPVQTNMMLHRLKLGSPETGFPTLERYDYTDHGLDADFLMLAGQSRKTWANEEMLDRFAHVLGVPKVTVVSPAPGCIRLQLRVFDTLADPTALSGVHNEVDLRAVPVGVTETGEIARIPILGTHGLAAGATGSGKGSIAYSILAGLAPAIQDGLVDVWCIDPKGGVEFSPAAKLFVRFEYETAERILALLKEAVAVMRERQAKLVAAGLRKHVPTIEEPLILILLDEAAALSAYADRDTRTAFEELLGLLLTQARATAISIFAFVQDPSKETMPQRQLFPVRIGLRLDEPTQVGMIFGAGARDRGARCDEIPDSTPGVGYIEQDGSTALTRVRFYWVSDDDIAWLVREYGLHHDIGTAAPGSAPPDFDPDDLGDEGEAA